MLGVVAGVCIAVLVLSGIGRRAPGAAVTKKTEGCQVSVLLIGTEGSPMAAAVDAATGGLGFGHVAWDACEHVSGVPYGIDCRPGYGVHRRPLAEILDGASFVRVTLPLVAGREAYGCARSRVGEVYDGLAYFTTTAAGRRRGTICSEMVYDCLPESLRSTIPVPTSRPLAPSDIARAWGIRGPGSPHVILDERVK